MGDGMTKEEYYLRMINELDDTNLTDILYKYATTHSELLVILYQYMQRVDSKMKRKKLERLLKKYLFLKQLSDRRYLLLADTHLGNSLANLQYINIAYEFGCDKHVTRAIHLGDFLEGCTGRTYQVREKKKTQIYQESIDQFELIHCYPRTIPTYILLGNHDVSFQTLGIDFIQEVYKRNPDLEILGYGSAYLKCHYRKLYLKHLVKNIPYLSSIYPYDLKLCGHSHCFRYLKKYNEFTVASLSDLQENKNSKHLLVPGFAILTIRNHSMDLEAYSFSSLDPYPVMKLTL